MQQVLSITGRLSVMSRDTTDGKVFTLRVDTAEISSSNPMLGSMFTIRSGIEMSWTTIQGVHAGVESTDSTADMGFGLLAEVLEHVTSDLPDSLYVGLSWSDTLAVDSAMAAEGVQTTGMAHWRVSGSIGHDYVIEGIATVVVSMEMGPSSTGGTMSGTVRRVVRSDGFAREATSEGSGTLEMLMGDQPMTATQRNRTSLLLLP